MSSPLLVLSRIDFDVLLVLTLSLIIADQELEIFRSGLEKASFHLRHLGMPYHLKEIMSRKLYGQSHSLEDTGQWSAYVREPKLGGTNSWIFLGSHLTQRLAPRCQDRGLLKLEVDPTMHMQIQLTFKREDYEEDKQLRETLNCDQFFDLLQEESSQSNTNYQNWTTTNVFEILGVGENFGKPLNNCLRRPIFQY